MSALFLLAGPDKLVCGVVDLSFHEAFRLWFVRPGLVPLCCSLGTDGGAHPEVACVSLLRSRATQAAAKMNAQHDGSRSASLDHWLCVVVHAAPRTLTPGIVRFIPNRQGICRKGRSTSSYPTCSCCSRCPPPRPPASSQA